MDLFHRAQEPEKRELTWVKPFDNRMDEILRLKEKSETCPKEMKKVFYKQLLTYLRLMNLNVGILVNFNTDNILESIDRVVN